MRYLEVSNTIIMLGIVAGGMVLLFQVTRKMFVPLSNMAETAQLVGQGNFHVKMHDTDAQDELGMVTSEVVISAPDTREGNDDIYEENSSEVNQFWRRMMDRFGNESEYNAQIINQFKNAPEPELLIVVDKLLTGFDAPKNSVLYIARSLKEHGLLQAIARVNRLEEGKDYGEIIDYYGLLTELDEALLTYSNIGDFDESDIQDALISAQEEIKKLPQLHSDLWEILME